MLEHIIPHFLIISLLHSGDILSKIGTFRWLIFYAVGSKLFRPVIQKPRQMENAVRDIQCHIWVTSSQMWKVCWNKGRLCWKIANLFYFCHLKMLVMPETFGPCCVRPLHATRLCCCFLDCFTVHFFISIYICYILPTLFPDWLISVLIFCT